MPRGKEVVVQKRKGMKTPSSKVHAVEGGHLVLMTRPDGNAANIPSSRRHEMIDRGFTDGHGASASKE